MTTALHIICKYHCPEFIFLGMSVKPHHTCHYHKIQLDLYLFGVMGALICLLNKRVAEVGSPASIGVHLICNRAKLKSSLLSRHFWWCTLQILCMLLHIYCSDDSMLNNNLLNIQVSAKLSKLAWNEICVYIWHYFLWKSKFYKHNLSYSNQAVSWKAIWLLYNSKLAVVIYNAQYCIIFNSVYISTNHLPGFVQHLIWFCLLKGMLFADD